MLPKQYSKDSLRLARRGFLISACCAVAVMSFSPAYSKSKTAKKILFVCQYGTAKSVIAREFFRKRALQRGIEIQAISRGITIEDHITPTLRKYLVADGIDPNIEPIRVLTKEDWEASDIVIAFNPLPSNVLHPDVRNWTDLPPVNGKYKKSRAIMKRRIDALLDEISKP